MQPHPLPLGVLLLVAAACRSTAPEDVRQLIDRQQGAWNARDVERFMRIGYWESKELTFFSGGDVVRGFDAMLERYMRSYVRGGAETGTLTFSEVEVLPLGGGHALARGRWFVDFEKKEDQGGLFTLVLQDRPEGWRVVHDHTSVGTSKVAKVQ
jgi:ketosteroid isomerase-like protein